MAYEFTVKKRYGSKFSATELQTLRDFLRMQRAYACSRSLEEIWMKETNSSWNYDIRIFLNSDLLLFEMSINDKVVWELIRHIIEYINTAISATEVVDEDGDSVL